MILKEQSTISSIKNMYITNLYYLGWINKIMDNAKVFSRNLFEPNLINPLKRGY